MCIRDRYRGKENKPTAIILKNNNLHVEIIINLVSAELVINDITVDFVVGYGLDDDPDEIFYHETPLNLTIQ